jgi:hypothetical protein
MKYLALVIIVLLATACTTKQEVDINRDRFEAWAMINSQRTYQPVNISGIRKIEGENIQISTYAILPVEDAPDVQYDTSDTDTIKHVTGIIGAVTGIGLLSNSKGNSYDGDYNSGSQSQSSSVNTTTSTVLP